ncbi:MAG: hypothetical protein ABJO97_03995 [Roseibium sp.]|uniref:hypothetical protein n=1 Tax=Alphaproteobacteria TaxID=28211 RepID=UPI003265920F
MQLEKQHSLSACGSGVADVIALSQLLINARSRQRLSLSAASSSHQKKTNPDGFMSRRAFQACWQTVFGSM